MNRATYELTVAALVTFAAGVVALADIAWQLRIVGGVVALLLPAAGLWWSLGHFGPHACYYARGRNGAVIYVGQMARRRDSIGDADITQRLREHLADADDKPWKRDISIANSTVARRCWTTAGLSWSERRRIAALSAASRRGMCGPLRNELLVPGDDDGRHTLAVWWYALESRLSLDDGAAWHRPVRRVSTTGDVWSSDVLDDADSDADDDTVDDDDAPIVVTADYARPPGRPWPGLLALGPVLGDGGRRDSRHKGPKGPDGGGTGGHVHRGTGAGGDNVGPGRDGADGAESAVNGDSGASDGSSAVSDADDVERRREREREKKRRQRARRRAQGDGEAA